MSDMNDNLTPEQQGLLNTAITSIQATLDYQEPTIIPFRTILHLEDIIGHFQEVTAVPTWTPKTFRDSFATNTSSKIIYYYDFTNSVWKFVGSNTSVLGTTGAISLDPTLGTLFTITPTGATQITPSAYPKGVIMVVRILTSGTSSYVITFDTGFVANGTLATGTLSGRYFTVTFACDGTYWIELSRTPAMLPT